jgi:hypothetical protein
MLFISLWSLKYYRIKNEISILFGLLLLMLVIWLTVLLLIYLLHLNPLSVTQVRSYILLNTESVSRLIFATSQFLYILTSILRVNQFNGSLRNKDNWIIRCILYIIIIIISFIINSGNIITENVYTGNVTTYWSGLPLVFILTTSSWILFQKKFDINYLFMLNVIVLIWLLHGNRSEILLLFIFGNYLYFSTIQYFKSNKYLLFFTLFIAGSIAFILFTYIGMIRSGHSEISTMINGDRLNIQTFGSSVYSAIVAVNIADLKGLLYGETYIGLFLNIIPSFIPTPWERYSDIATKYLDEYQMLGGFGIIGDSYINFGYFGPIIISFIFTYILYFLIKNIGRSWYYSFAFLSLILYSQRYILYGTTYLFKILTVLFIIYIIIQLLPRKFRSKGKV